MLRSRRRLACSAISRCSDSKCDSPCRSTLARAMSVRIDVSSQDVFMLVAPIHAFVATATAMPVYLVIEGSESLALALMAVRGGMTGLGKASVVETRVGGPADAGKRLAAVIVGAAAAWETMARPPMHQATTVGMTAAGLAKAPSRTTLWRFAARHVTAHTHNTAAPQADPGRQQVMR